MKLIIFLLLSIVGLKCYLFDEAKLVIVPNLTMFKTIKISPNGSMFALGFQDGQLIIYDKSGKLLMSRNDHSTEIVGIQWIDQEKGPITISTTGRIVFMNDLQGNVTTYQTGHPLLENYDYVTTSWKVSNQQQYLAFYSQKKAIEWDIVKQVQVGIYLLDSAIQTRNVKFNLPSGPLQYVENGKYLITGYNTFITDLIVESSVSYFDRVTKLLVKKYLNDSLTFTMKASKQTSKLVVGYYTIDQTDSHNYSVRQYTQNSFIGETSVNNTVCDIAYCGSEFIVGGRNFMSVFDSNYNFKEDIRGITLDVSQSPCKLPLHCTNESLFILDYLNGLFIVNKLAQPSPDPPTPNDDGIPEWIIIVAIVFFALTVMICFILICIKQKTGITTYKCFKRCFKKKDHENQSLYSDSSDFRRY